MRTVAEGDSLGGGEDGCAGGSDTGGGQDVGGDGEGCHGSDESVGGSSSFTRSARAVARSRAGSGLMLSESAARHALTAVKTLRRQVHLQYAALALLVALLAVLAALLLRRVGDAGLLPQVELPSLGDLNVSLQSLNERISDDIERLREAFKDLPLPGEGPRSEGVEARHPVVILPGFVTTGLEVWESLPCARAHFRQRMWGSSQMAQSFLANPECWMQHVSLNATTGLDPDGVRLRAMASFAAVDYFVQGYPVWGPLIESLALVGYDPSTVHVASYDWRLGMRSVQARDGYFSQLRAHIETQVAHSGRKAVVVSHSFGEVVFRHFMRWVEADAGGGPQWVSRHVHALASIGGVGLGLPKALTSVLSGEMSDTAALGEVVGVLVDRVVQPLARRAVFRSWHSPRIMLPIGGDKVWGDASHAPDDIVARDDSGVPHNVTLGRLITVVRADAHVDALTTEEAIDALMSDWHPREGGGAEEPRRAVDDLGFTNPLTNPLPNAPNLTIYALYGVGLPTERAYVYSAQASGAGGGGGSAQGADPGGGDGAARGGSSSSSEEAEISDGGRIGDAAGEGGRGASRTASSSAGAGSPDGASAPVPGRIARHMPGKGVVFADGDGTVPLLSLGFMPIEGWKRPEHNPHGVKTVVREYRHMNDLVISSRHLHAGPRSGDHVGIMSNAEVIADVVRIAGGREPEERVVSQIREIAARVPKTGLA